ncbi:unnamed protein product [Heterobilharzia americana]|nr:unnamed protein product [Heterobilharzia americana]
MSCSEVTTASLSVKRCCEPVYSEKSEKNTKYPRLSDNLRSNIIDCSSTSNPIELTPTNILNDFDNLDSPVCGSDRLAQLSALIDQCSHGELLHIKRTIKPLLKRDFIAHLPAEISLRILKYLSPRDIFHCTQVSRNWLHICNDNLLWYYVCTFTGLSNLLYNGSLVKYYSDSQHDCPLCIHISTSAVCNETNSCIEQNMKNDHFITVTEDKYIGDMESDPVQVHNADEELTSLPCSTVSSMQYSHVNKVNWKSLYRQYLHTQCNGETVDLGIQLLYQHTIIIICIWNISTGQCLINLFGHLGGVWSLTVISRQFCTNKKDFHQSDQYPLLISGSCDRTARVWQLDGQRWPCIATLFGHQSTVRCLASQKPRCSPKFVLDNTDCDDSFSVVGQGGLNLCTNDNSDATDNDGDITAGDDDSEKEFTIQNIFKSSRNNHNNNHHCDDVSKNLSVNLTSNQSCDTLIVSSEFINPNVKVFHQQTLENSHLVVTGSRDTTLRLWNALTGECMQEFRGHRGAIRCVQFTGDQIVSGSYDCTIRLWCALQGHCLRVFSAHTNRVYTLLFDGYHIISGSLDTTIRIWNAHTGVLKQTFYGHRSLTSELAFGSEQNILVSSNADETIRVWHIHSGKCVHVLAGPHKHQSAVTCVQLTRNFIISSGDDGTVKLWDKQSGAYIRDLLRLDGAGRGGVIWRIVASENRLICAAGSRIGMEPTKLVILRFQEPQLCSQHSNHHHSNTNTNNNKSMTFNHVCRPRHKYAPEPRLSQLMCTSLGTC